PRPGRRARRNGLLDAVAAGADHEPRSGARYGRLRRRHLVGAAPVVHSVDPAGLLGARHPGLHPRALAYGPSGYRLSEAAGNSKPLAYVPLAVDTVEPSYANGVAYQ